MMIILLITFFIIAVLCYSIIPSMLLKIIYYAKVPNNTNGKSIYLTFDDGPTSKYTPLILELLKKYNIKACFFMVSDFANENQAIVTRIKEDGHDIGLHSSEHKNAIFCGYRYVKNDFNKSVSTLKQLGCNFHYYRPPWGHFNIFSLYFMKQYKLKLVLWQVMAEDWSKNATPLSIENKLLKRIKSGSIICLHDGRGAKFAPLNTYRALETTIPALLSQGYSFKSLDEYYEKRTLR